MLAKDLCRYEENKSKYYVQKKEGLVEIEKNPLIKYGGKKKVEKQNDDNKIKNEKVSARPISVVLVSLFYKTYQKSEPLGINLVISLFIPRQVNILKSHH